MSEYGKHEQDCTPHYPEKVPGEAPQALERVDLGDGDWVDVCVDCGAVMAMSGDQ